MSTDYVGNELDLFSEAKNWKRYWFSKIEQFLGDDILEVGAGLGTNSILILTSGKAKGRLDCLEPDIKLANQILLTVQKSGLSSKNITVNSKYLSECDASIKYDSILYIDVIEHIENDRAELELAMSFLKPKGRLIILVPAHNFLFSEFDKSIGHFRRYNKKMLLEIFPKNLSINFFGYLDSIGLLASMANKLFLKQNYPKLKQIQFWDSTMIPLSRFTDRLFRHKLGKSLLLVGEAR